MQLTDAQIKRFVLDTGLVSRKDIDTAHTLAEERSLPFADALRTQGSLTDDDIRRATAYIFGVPYVSLLKRTIEPAALRLLPEPIARAEHAIVYSETPELVEVALLDLTRFPHIEERVNARGRKIVPRLTDEASLQSALGRYQQLLRAEYGDVLVHEARIVKRGGDASTTSVTRIVDTLFHHALAQQASTIHLEPSAEVCYVRYRIAGILHDAMELPAHIFAPLYARITELARLTGPEDLPREGRFRITHDGEKISVRVRTLPMHAGTHITLHLTRAWGHGFTLDGLGLHGETLHDVTHVLTLPRTSMLVVGLPESGKTTMLYTLLDTARTPTQNVMTIESSIGASLARINQVCLRPELGFDTHAALRAALRNDPDIVALDTDTLPEDASTLCAAATTRGIQTYATLSGSSAAEGLLAFARTATVPGTPVALTHVMGVATVRTLGSLREKYYLTAKEVTKLREVARMADVLDRLKEEGVVAKNATWSAIPFFRIPMGEDEATAYRGTTGIHELLRTTPEMLASLAENPTPASILAQATQAGMMTLVEDAIMKAAMGITTIDEVFRVAAAYYR